MNKTVFKANQNTYLVNFPINGHCEAEDILGFPITKLDDDNAGISTFRTLFFVGLKYGGNPVTMDKAGEIMGEIIADRGMSYFSQQISEAINKGLQQQNSQNFKQNHNKKKY